MGGPRGRLISASDRIKAIELIGEATKHGASLSKACIELDITERTYYRWCKLLKETGRIEDLRPLAERPEPANKLSSEEEQEILDIVKQPEFASLSPCEIVPLLADKGIYIASESTFYRVLRKYDLQHHRGRSAEGIHRPISTHYATGENQVWMWDITYLAGPIKGKHYYLYLISDLFSRKIVGWEVWPEETAEHASELIRRAIISEKIAPPRTQPLVLHSDNGSPMKGATMLETLYRLGITPSNSRPRVSNDNPYAESLFKTLKYRCNYQPKGFATITEARLWCKQFENWYNNEHHHSGINYLTPNQRHSGQGNTILKASHALYQAAMVKHPERPEKVWLNPEKDTVIDECTTSNGIAS